MKATLIFIAVYMQTFVQANHLSGRLGGRVPMRGGGGGPGPMFGPGFPGGPDFGGGPGGFFGGPRGGFGGVMGPVGPPQGPPGRRDFEGIRIRNGGLPIFGGAGANRVDGAPAGFGMGPGLQGPGFQNNQGFNNFIQQNGPDARGTGVGGIFGGPRAAGGQGRAPFIDPTNGQPLQVVSNDVANTVRDARIGGVQMFGNRPGGAGGFPGNGMLGGSGGQGGVQPIRIRIPASGRPLITRGGVTQTLPDGMTLADLGFAGIGGNIATGAAGMQQGGPAGQGMGPGLQVQGQGLIPDLNMGPAAPQGMSQGFQPTGFGGNNPGQGLMFNNRLPQTNDAGAQRLPPGVLGQLTFNTNQNFGQGLILPPPGQGIQQQAGGTGTAQGGGPAGAVTDVTSQVGGSSAGGTGKIVATGNETASPDLIVIQMSDLKDARNFPSILRTMAGIAGITDINAHTNLISGSQKVAQ